MTDAVLVLSHLSVDFAVEEDRVSAVTDVSLSVARGEIFGLVGESGCGKSTLALAIMGLLPRTARVRGQIAFEGRELIGLGERELRALRGDRISMVFQDPLTSLDPTFGVGEQVAETVEAHRAVTRDQARTRALQLMNEVGIPASEHRYAEPPHRFSGGMRQRVVVATALANDPALLLADEPTTALDVTIQAQILDLLAELKERLGMAIMLITHAMGVVAEVAQRVVVMYAGQVVEEASVEELFAHPRHPYTQGLIRSIPRIDTAALQKVRLEQIPGTVPKLIDPAEGCRFAARCKYAVAACIDATPALREPVPGHKVRCILDVFPAAPALVIPSEAKDLSLP